jgi:peptidoglycan/LPS O-acetylase OafA/YrhL
MKHRDSILDLIRGLSALLVMLGHLRGFIFLDYDELGGTGVLTKGFYFATGLGHQAVMVFFVLSGYFVGGSVLSGLAKGRFSWRGYGTARLARLWMVLVPALLLTLGVDLLGQQWNPGAYAGELKERFMSGPTAAVPAALDWVTFLGNLGFIQSVRVPVYGTNGPLWSLANEFWYYVMFPLIAVTVAQFCGLRGRVVGLFQMLLFALLVWWLPTGLLLGGLIWLLGAGVWWLVRKTDDGGQGAGAKVNGWCRGWPWRVAGGLLFLGTLAASKTDHWIGSDGAVGCAFAVWMLALTGAWRFPAWLDRIVAGLSEISYTLYVVHFPLLFFVAAVLLGGKQFPADAAGFLWFSGLAAAILGVSIAMWWLFERNTNLLRKWLSGTGRERM